MQAFRFSLEQVLVYRRQLEEQAVLRFHQIVEARDNRKREKETIEALIQQNHMRLADSTLLEGGERWLITRYINALTLDRERAKLDLISLEEEVDRLRAELTQKAQDRKLLEKLKEKQTIRYNLEENRKEQQNYDNITTIRYMPPAI